jgi:hypothetical protein
MSLNAWLIKRFNLNGEPERLPIEISGYRRELLGDLFAELGFTVGAEIGVHLGGFSESLLKANPKLHLYCIDPYQDYPDFQEKHIAKNQEDMNVNFEAAKKRLAPYNATFIRKMSMDAVNDFKDNSLDFVYIDGHHGLSYVINDLEWWGRKVKPEGIISGHDYHELETWAWSKCPNYRVIEAVDCFVKSYDIRPWFLIGRRREERHRSFLWVKH